jgi:triosephosphate isomerase
MRKPVIAGNWKMNTSLEEGKALIQDIVAQNNQDHCDVIICPPFTHLGLASELLNDSKIALGAQNMNESDSGAFTGEIAAEMLKNLDCTYVILGHSERRSIYNESHELINAKIKQALKHGLNPIFCVGEHLSERENNQTLDVITTQLKEGLKGISADEITKTDLIVAYEPVWAIGTGKVATPEQAQEVHAHIRQELAAIFNSEIAEKTRLQYGGSVKPDNAASLLSQHDIDGALIGGACLKAGSFLEIASAAA